MSDKTGSADAEGDAPLGARWESYMSQYLFTHTRAHTRELVLTQVLAAAPSSSLKVELMETSSSSCINSLSTMYHCQTLLTHTHTHTHVAVLLFSSSFTHQLSSRCVSAGLSTPFISVSAAPPNAQHFISANIPLLLLISSSFSPAEKKLQIKPRLREARERQEEELGAAGLS